MSAEIVNAVIFFENMLGAVAVVGVEIDDEYPLVADGPRIPGTDRDIVEDAKPHPLVGLGMMSRRANRAERAPDFSFFATFHCFHDGAGRVQRRVKSAFREIGVGIELVCSTILYLLDILAGVNKGEFIEGRPAGPDGHEPGPETRRFERDDDIDQTVRGIGMPVRRLMPKTGLIIYKTDVVHN